MVFVMVFELWVVIMGGIVYRGVMMKWRNILKV